LAALYKYRPPSKTLPAVKLRVNPDNSEGYLIYYLIHERSILEKSIEDLLLIYLST
jgi:hypothetical protein